MNSTAKKMPNNLWINNPEEIEQRQFIKKPDHYAASAKDRLEDLFESVRQTQRRSIGTLEDIILFHYRVINALFDEPNETFVYINDPTDNYDNKLQAFRKEQEAFLSTKEDLKRDYEGLYVAIYGGKVVDSDKNESELIKRFYKQYGNVSVYIDKINKQKFVPKHHAPRKVK